MDAAVETVLNFLVLIVTLFVIVFSFLMIWRLTRSDPRESEDPSKTVDNRQYALEEQAVEHSIERSMFEYSKRYHEQELRHATAWFWVSIVAGSIGFLLIWFQAVIVPAENNLE